MLSLKSALLLIAALVVGPVPALVAAEPSAPRPDVILVVVDTLRADHLSAYGAAEPLTPHLDRLFRQGVIFENARTVEPLTGPAMIAAITGLEPHVHRASRNGIRMEEGLDSLPLRLAALGYQTQAFVANWTLRHELTGLGDHFEGYEEVFTRRRWFGLFKGEANALAVNRSIFDWQRRSEETPVFLWVHYVEPHAPYRFHPAEGRRLGVDSQDPSRADRYATEVAFVDAQIGLLIRRLDLPRSGAQTWFLVDHGESLGEHDYWGHGRHLFDSTLHVPLALVWPDHVAVGANREPVLLTDIAPTVLGLLHQQAPAVFQGRDLTPLLSGGTVPSQALCFQAHKGAVQLKHESDRARSRGLLAVGRLLPDGKEVFYVKEHRRLRFNLTLDPAESTSTVSPASSPSPALQSCIDVIVKGLKDADAFKVNELDEESREQLEALGYLD